MSNKHKIEKITKLKNKLFRSIEGVKMAYEDYKKQIEQINSSNAVDVLKSMNNHNMEIYKKKVKVVRAYENIRTYHVKMAIECANPESEISFDEKAKKEFTNMFDCRMYTTYFNSNDTDAFGFLKMEKCLNIDCNNIIVPFKLYCNLHECESKYCVAEKKEGNNKWCVNHVFDIERQLLSVSRQYFHDN